MSFVLCMLPNPTSETSFGVVFFFHFIFSSIQRIFYQIYIPFFPVRFFFSTFVIIYIHFPLNINIYEFCDINNNENIKKKLNHHIHNILSSTIKSAQVINFIQFPKKSTFHNSSLMGELNCIQKHTATQQFTLTYVWCYDRHTSKCYKMQSKYGIEMQIGKNVIHSESATQITKKK